MVSLFNAGKDFYNTASGASTRAETVRPITEGADIVTKIADAVKAPKKYWDSAKSHITRPVAKSIVYVAGGICTLATLPCRKNGKTLGERSCEKLAASSADKCVLYALEQAQKTDLAKNAASSFFTTLQDSSPYVRMAAQGVGFLSGAIGYQSSTHAVVDGALRTMGIRNKLINRVFYPLLLEAQNKAGEATKMVAVAGTKYVLDLAIDSAALWGAGAFNIVYNLDKFKATTEMAEKIAMGAKGIALAYAYGPTVYKGNKLVIQACLFRCYLKKIDGILSTGSGAELVRKLGLPEVAGREILKGVMVAATDNGLFKRSSLGNDQEVIAFLSLVIKMLA